MILIDEQIRKYRPQIMGIAAIGVLATHSNGIAEWHPLLRKLLGFGGTGVYVFVFLSAIGLYNSLRIRGEGYSKFDFYKRRFARLIIPYCLIAATWYGIYDLQMNGSFTLFLYDFSTISYWLEHRGAWYVAMLIPVYFLFPWFYDWAETKNRKLRVLGSLIFIVALSFLCFITLPELYEHLAQVFCSVIIYLIGYYYAGLDEKSDKNGIVLCSICLVLFGVKTVSLVKVDFISDLTWAMLGIAFTFISAGLINRINNKGVNAFWGFFGKHSLEMYLWNIFVMKAMQTFNVIDFLKENGDTYGYVSYGIVVVLGCLLSIIYGRLSAWIVQKFIYPDIPASAGA